MQIEISLQNKGKQQNRRKKIQKATIMSAKIQPQKPGFQNINSADGLLNKTIEFVLAKKSNSNNKKKNLKNILISIPYQIVITILTVYSLFGDDIRTVGFGKNQDIFFDVVNIILMIVFGLEIVLSSIALENYFLSFFFFLDIISSLSLLIDISLFTEIIFLSSQTNNYTFSKMATQSKASRAAIRAVRVVKLFRIIRIVKLYKSAVKAQEIKENKSKEKKLKKILKQKFDKIYLKKRNQLIQNKFNPKVDNNHELTEQYSISKIVPSHGVQKTCFKDLNNKISPSQAIQFSEKVKIHNNFKLNQRDGVQQQDQIERRVLQQEVNELLDNSILEEMDQRESKIRKKLGDTTLKKIIIVVLMLMFIVPLFDTEIYTNQANSIDLSLSSMETLLNLPSSTLPTSQLISLIQKIIAKMKSDEFNLIYFKSPFNQLPTYQDDDFNNIRIADLVTSSVTIDISTVMKKRIDLTLRKNFDDQIDKASLQCILNQKFFNTYQGYLSIARTLFICFLLIFVLYFFNCDIEELIVKPIEEMMKKLKSMAEDPEAASKQEINLNAEYQTTIVSNAIIKIGTLLSIVFGSAGAEIIGKNIVQQGDMNPMIEGKKKCAIFGFCDIHKFTQINQILEEDILKFVNQISSIVHKAVYRYGGSANKNIGEAFLLVWKIPQNGYTINNENNEMQWHNKSYLNVLADFSVYSFIKILIKINKSRQILDYRNDYRLLAKIPNYKVQMGFGLHIGWAIEGAIGSDYKIDASYLSPNVNMASRLEAATKQFGVNLLISQNLHDLLSPGLQSFCRNIDRVTVKGSNKPLKLYTIDMNLQNISAPADKTLKYPNIPSYEPNLQLKRDINLQFLQPDQIKNYSAENFIKSKKQLRQVLINAVPFDFKMRFQEGVKCYLAGKWSDAKLHFTHAQKIKSNDGPTKRLLSYMKNYEYVAPTTWKNFRQLTSK